MAASLKRWSGGPLWCNFTQLKEAWMNVNWAGNTCCRYYTPGYASVLLERMENQNLAWGYVPQMSQQQIETFYKIRHIFIVYFSWGPRWVKYFTLNSSLAFYIKRSKVRFHNWVTIPEIEQHYLLRTQQQTENLAVMWDSTLFHMHANIPSAKRCTFAVICRITLPPGGHDS